MDSIPNGPATIAGLQPLIDLETLATYLGVPVATVYDWRGRRLGPRAYRIGKRLMLHRRRRSSPIAPSTAPASRT